MSDNDFVQHCLYICAAQFADDAMRQHDLTRVSEAFMVESRRALMLAEMLESGEVKLTQV